MPATANTVSNTAVVIIAFFETNLLFCFSIFSVKVTNSGTLPTGLTTTKREITAFRRSSPKVSDVTNKLENLVYTKLTDSCICKGTPANGLSEAASLRDDDTVLK